MQGRAPKGLIVSPSVVCLVCRMVIAPGLPRMPSAFLIASLVGWCSFGQRCEQITADPIVTSAGI